MSPEARLLHSSWPCLTWDSNLTIHTDPGVDVHVEDQLFGQHRAHLNLPAGTYQVRLEDRFGRTRRASLVVEDNRLTVAVPYVRPECTTFLAAAVLTGGGQFYRGDTVRGVLAMSSVAGLTTAGVLFDRDLRNRSIDFDVRRAAYRGATATS